MQTNGNKKHYYIIAYNIPVRTGGTELPLPLMSYSALLPDFGWKSTRLAAAYSITPTDSRSCEFEDTLI